MRLYNTLSRQTEDLTPLNDNQVKIYTCGLTVYSQPHIGNWVGYIYWDVLVRTLQAEGYHVERTQNYTDVGHLTSDDDSGEDKMEKGARQEGLTAWDIANKYIDIAEYEAYDLLGFIRPDHIARATDYIPQQIAFVQALEEKGFTYSIPGEGVYFDTAKLKDYGKLARLDIDGLEAGARVAVSGKHNATDFALWKYSPVDKKRDMEWDSPWGKGFPGWHLECSVIARETLGNQIDIHTGGIDHIPVHHTNEIAQTEAVTGKQFSQIWLHNNHLKVNGAKMAKSLGNIYTLADIIEHDYSLEAFKLMVLSKQYRTEGNFTWEILEAAQNRLCGYKEAAALQWQPVKQDNPVVYDFDAWLTNIRQQLSEDLSTPTALAILSEQLEAVKSSLITAGQIDAFRQYLKALDSLLGLHLSETPNVDSTVQDLLQQRAVARDSKDWAASDAIREQLESAGLAVRDTAAGQIWYWV